MDTMEATALVNLLTVIPESCQDELMKDAMNFGMLKGPITHAGVACDRLGVGAGPKCASPKWTESMVNKDTICLLITQRLLKDCTEPPRALQKPVGLERICNMQKVC